MIKLEQVCIVLGERRKLSLSVTIDGSTDFTLINPTYTLSGQGEVVKGDCEIVNTSLVVYIKPSFSGWYTLEVEFDLMTGEHIIRTTTVLVSE